MADWGLYAALRGTDNWAQRRADEQMEMQVLEKHAAKEEKKTQQNMVAEENINKYLDEMANIDVLPEDQERIQEVERQARFNIVKGIASNNGDLARYVASGGITDLHEYKNSIIQSGEVKTAMSNKENMAKIIADKQAGNRWFKPMEVDVPQVDPETNEPILDADGNQVTKREFKTVDEQLSLFKNGIINTVQYNGSENKVKMNALAFKGAFKDDKNKSGSNTVTTSDIVFKAMEAGASEEYANHLADTYAKRVKKGGDTWKWKSLDPMEVALQEAKINTERAKAQKAKTGSSKQTIANSIIPAIQRLGKNGQPNEMVMDGKQRKLWNNQFGLQYDTKTGAWNPSNINKGGIDIENGAEYDLNNALSVNLGNKYVSRTIDGVTKRYIEAEVIYDANNHTKNNPHDETMGWDQLRDDQNVNGKKSNRHNWTYHNASEVGLAEHGGLDVWKGTVLIPVEQEINTATFRTYMNKYMNLTSNIDASAASATDADYLNYSATQIKELQTKYSKKLGREVTAEEVLAALKQNARI